MTTALRLGSGDELLQQWTDGYYKKRYYIIATNVAYYNEIEATCRRR